MKLREAFETACAERRADMDKYQRTFELMHDRLPSNDEREMIMRRCAWYEGDQAQSVAA